MSFDLFLQAFNAGASAPVARDRVLAVLREHCQDAPDKFGFYRVQFSDGSDVEFSAKGLESSDEFTGCAFHVRGFSAGIVSFVFGIAKAGDMVIFNPQAANTVRDPSVILTAESQQANLPDMNGMTAAVCSSAEHLAKMLGIGFEKWADYRDSVVAKS